MVDKTKLSNSPANSFTTADKSIYLLISSAKRQVFLFFFFYHAEVRMKKYQFASLLTKFASLAGGIHQRQNTETLSYGRRLNDKPSDYFAFRRIDNIFSIMKSPTEIHSNSAIELQVYHLITCYHNFCITSLLSRQQSFPLQVKRICRDYSFVTLVL